MVTMGGAELPPLVRGRKMKNAYSRESTERHARPTSMLLSEPPMLIGADPDVGSVILYYG